MTRGGEGALQPMLEAGVTQIKGQAPLTRQLLGVGEGGLELSRVEGGRHI